MTTDELIARFEDGSLPGEAFHHAEHVQAAWGYLRRHQLPDALARFSAALQRFATANGAPGKYDAALTAAWFARIAERMAQGDEPDWPAFARRHPDLTGQRAASSCASSSSRS